MKKHHQITLIPGDGVGPEIVSAMVDVLEATGVAFKWETVELNSTIMDRSSTAIPENIIRSIKKNKTAIKGPISTPVGKGFISPNVLLRKQLGLYASIRPAKSLPGIPAKNNIDVIVVRENTEDLYSGIENMVGPDKVIASKVITRQASERVARCAFELAISHNRRKVTAFHKADIMKLADGLFLESCQTVAKEFQTIRYEEAIVDSACMQLILDPGRFDVIVTENMYGDIVSDITAALIGGLGLAGSMNIGDGIAVYEAVHGSAPDIVGKGIANPTGLLMAAVAMLRNLNEQESSTRLNQALLAVLGAQTHVTADLGGNATTKEFRDAVIAKLKAH